LSLSGSGIDSGNCLKSSLDLSPQTGRVNAELRYDGGNDAFFLSEKYEEQMKREDFLVASLLSKVLGKLKALSSL
jgi:hypothetical protein